jgi:hypothetical protein
MAIVYRKGLSWGIYEFPVIGGVMRFIENNTNISFDLNASPQLRVLVPLGVSILAGALTAGVASAGLVPLLAVTAAGGTASAVAVRGADEYNQRIVTADNLKKIEIMNKDLATLEELGKQAEGAELENIERAKAVLKNERNKTLLILGGGSALVLAGIIYYFKAVK